MVKLSTTVVQLYYVTVPWYYHLVQSLYHGNTILLITYHGNILDVP